MKPATLLASALVAAAAFAQPAPAQSSDWSWRANLYGWFPSVDATAKFPASPASGASIGIEADPGGYLSKLQFAFMGTLEARKGPWLVFGDVVVFDFGNVRSDLTSISLAGMTVPLPTSADLSADLEGTVLELGAGYSVVQTSTTTLDVIGGARHLRVKAGLDWALGPVPPGVPAQGHSERTRDFWDGVIGVRGRTELAPQWYASYYADIGAGQSDSTWQAFAGVGYHFGWGDALIGYRHLAYKFDDANSVSELTFSGPLIGIGFRW